MKKVKIVWQPRYSKTMEDDKQGRWARIAYAGNFNTPVGFYRNKVAVFEIAWVKKVVHDGKTHFVISYDFPSKGKHIFQSLEKAQKEVENQFNWFIKMVLKN